MKRQIYFDKRSKKILVTDHGGRLIDVHNIFTEKTKLPGKLKSTGEDYAPAGAWLFSRDTRYKIPKYCVHLGSLSEPWMNTYKKENGRTL